MIKYLIWVVLIIYITCSICTKSPIDHGDPPKDNDRIMEDECYNTDCIAMRMNNRY